MTSFVWKLFCTQDSADCVAQCLICHKFIRRGSLQGGRKSYSTTPLHNHAKKLHIQEYEAAKNSCNSLGYFPGGASSSSSSLPTVPADRKLVEVKTEPLEESFANEDVWSTNDHRSVEIHNKISLMMALDNHSPSLAEDDGFVMLMAHLQPRYLVPKSDFFAETAIPQLFEHLKATIAAELSHADFVSFSSDLWLCPRLNETFISFSVHWLSPTFQHRNAVLYASHFPETHPEVNLSSRFISICESWSLERRITNLLVRNDLAPFDNSTAYIKSLQCTIHLIQLVINDAILSQRVAVNILAKCRRLASHFQRSADACSEFKAMQSGQYSLNAPVLIPSQDVPSRWVSTYLMLDRLLIVRRYVERYLAVHRELPALSAMEWEITGHLVNLLTPFFTLTQEMSSSFCTLSTVYPSICNLERIISLLTVGEEVKITKHELLTSLRYRFFSQDKLNIRQKRDYAVATAIDPRFKLQFFHPDQEKQVKAWLLEEIMSTQSRGPESELDHIPLPAKKSRCDEDYLECLFNSTKSNNPQNSAMGITDDMVKSTSVTLIEAIEEMDQYFKFPVIGRNHCPFTYWRLENKFPLLKRLSKKLLATPASSIFLEKDYSNHGDIFEVKRSKTLSKQNDLLLFVHCNGRKFTV